nr:fimbria/pilus outer membrane usher protein [Enterobacter asburiae]
MGRRYSGTPSELQPQYEPEYRDADRSTTSSFAQLNPGINLGAWRLRSQSSWHKQGNAEGKWQTTNTYAKRGLYGLCSTLTLGERTTEDPLFAGIPFRGVMLATDASMVPYNERAFAPIVRGIARTQARVEVRQNGYLLQETNVAPGPFALRDLPVGGTWGGDLQVTVRESDGSVQTFSLPYQAPAVAVREGYLSYNIMAGQYRPSSRDTEEANIAHGLMVYDLPYDLTVFGGAAGGRSLPRCGPRYGGLSWQLGCSFCGCNRCPCSAARSGCGMENALQQAYYCNQHHADRSGLSSRDARLRHT